MGILIDISGYQDERGAIDFARLKAAGIEGVIIKATEAAGTSPYFVRDATAASAAGLKVGVYAFTRPDVGAPERQADVFSALAAQAPRLDWWADDAEVGGSTGASSWGDWHGRFCAQVDTELVGVRASFVYSAQWCLRFGSLNDPRLTKRSLWLAQYGGTVPAPLPGWAAVALWQDRSNAVYPGIVGPVDEDITQAAFPPFSAQTGVQAVGSPHLTDVIVSVPTPDGSGVYDVESDGGLWPVGNAPVFNLPDGSAGTMFGRMGAGRRIVDFAAYSIDGKSVTGYWFLQDDGGVFPFGAAPGWGSLGGVHLNMPAVALVYTPGRAGYVIKTQDGGAWPFGPNPPVAASEA